MTRWNKGGKNANGTGSSECAEDCSCGKHKYGKMHKNWTEDPTLVAVHQRLRDGVGSAKNFPCVDCEGVAKDWSRIHGKSGKSLDHYKPRCRKCHMSYDYQLRWGRPEYREMQSRIQRAKALRQWADPASRARLMKGIRKGIERRRAGDGSDNA